MLNWRPRGGAVAPIGHPPMGRVRKAWPEPNRLGPIGLGKGGGRAELQRAHARPAPASQQKEIGVRHVDARQAHLRRRLECMDECAEHLAGRRAGAGLYLAGAEPARTGRDFMDEFGDQLAELDGGEQARRCFDGASHSRVSYCLNDRLRTHGASTMGSGPLGRKRTKTWSKTNSPAMQPGPADGGLGDAAGSSKWPRRWAN